MILATEETYHSRRVICLVNASFLLLVVGGAVLGASTDDVMTSTSADTYFVSSSVAPPLLDLTVFSTDFSPLDCLFL